MNWAIIILVALGVVLLWRRKVEPEVPPPPAPPVPPPPPRVLKPKLPVAPPLVVERAPVVAPEPLKLEVRRRQLKQEALEHARHFFFAKEKVRRMHLAAFVRALGRKEAFKVVWDTFDEVYKKYYPQEAVKVPLKDKVGFYPLAIGEVITGWEVRLKT